MKGLGELSTREWESLCDGCGRCCLNKLEDWDTGEIVWTSLACTLFDGNAMAARQWIGKKMNKKAYIASLLKIVDETKALFDAVK